MTGSASTLVGVLDVPFERARPQWGRGGPGEAGHGRTRTPGHLRVQGSYDYPLPDYVLVRVFGLSSSVRLRWYCVQSNVIISVLFRRSVLI